MGVFFAHATDSSWTAGIVATSTSLWSENNANDNNTSTSWSSVTHDKAQNSESITYCYASDCSVFHNTNYIKLGTRLYNGNALGFPVEFTVKQSDGGSFHEVRSFTHFVRPTTQWVTLPLDTLVSTNGIQIVATVLGDDMSGNYVFQLSEVQGGYNDTLEGVEYTHTSGFDVSTALTGWPATNLDDSNLGTVWSSASHGIWPTQRNGLDIPGGPRKMLIT